MQLTKVVNNNITKNIVNSNIVEYNIKKAYPTILADINNKYEYLLSLTKSQYVDEINKIFKENPNIKKEVMNKTLQIYNEFLFMNNIKPESFLATTTDSILLVDQIAPINLFNNKFQFRNKDQVPYTSLFYINNDVYILFDRISKNIKIVGINDVNINSYPFVKKFLKDLCCILNDYSLETKPDCLKRMRNMRINYLNSQDKEIYRSIINNNMYKYNIDGAVNYSDIALKEDDTCILMKDENYMNFVLPLFQSFV